MKMLLMELVWWGVLLLFFWALRSRSGRSAGTEAGDVTGNAPAMEPRGRSRYWQPQAVAEPMGRYRDQPIYRYVTIEGCKYQFDHVCPPENKWTFTLGERHVAPGLVYVECGGQK